MNQQFESSLSSFHAAAPEPMTPTPEILEWASGLFTDEEILAGIREIQETGGLTFEDVIRGLEPPTTYGSDTHTV